MECSHVANVSVRVDGLTEAKATVALLPEAFREEVADAIDVGSRIILTEAYRRVPKPPGLSGKSKGTLAQSLGRYVRSDGLQASVGSGDKKAQWVEFATEDTPAQPFLYPAFRLGAKYIRRVMRDWADNAGNRARFKTKKSSRVGK